MYIYRITTTGFFTKRNWKSMKSFDHKEIERKWQKKWQNERTYEVSDDTHKKKCYVLDMFPYPSGEGLHVGHPKGYIATDVYARYMTMQGMNVLHPMGWDAFGLPAENYALKNKVHPAVAVKKNIARFKEQLEKIGFNYDWKREINTTDPAFYKWTQWIFIQLFKKGLAYESYEPINWCPSCKTGLANEDLDGNVCERCGTVVEKKPMRQWVLRITAYADRLLQDLDALPWSDSVKEMQRNWIGRSEGALLRFPVVNTEDVVEVFTTRPDTLFGATYMVLAPEHVLVSKHMPRIGNADEVQTYIQTTSKKTDIERTTAGKEKTGVLLEGLVVRNPANNKELPVYISDYVLAGYGAGAIMAVPAHDERDYAFAKKYNLPIEQVVIPYADDTNNPPQEGYKEVKRETVIVFLKNKETGMYALLDWHGTLEGITTGIMGGVEEGQTPEDAVYAEIEEEVALKGISITKKLRWITAARYCASHKKENRLALSHVFLAEVDTCKNQGEIPDEEKAKHTLTWVTEQEVLEKLTPDHQKQIWRLLQEEEALPGEGVLMNSGKFSGLSSEEAKKKITELVVGELTINYRLQDWVFSRQRYWGEPIPVVHCDSCGVVPVREEDLPVLLPDVESYEPTGTGESPLASIEDWVHTECPKCGGKAKRETNTMPQWAGSSWYHLRYIDPKNDTALVDKNKEAYWSPVDVYVGGMEHATRHLIYARFWHKFLYDIGAVTTSEPYQKLYTVGLILAQDGRKMSKRWGNVINPDDVVSKMGADALRIYEMFMGPFGQAIAWSTDHMVGARRFLERVNGLQEKIDFAGEGNNILLHQTIKKVDEDIASFDFNTAISQLMILVNDMEKRATVQREEYKILVTILAPFAPHLTEELWEKLGHKHSIHKEVWPTYDEKIIQEAVATIAVQVNGKVRGSFTALPTTGEVELKELAKQVVTVKPHLEGREIVREIVVLGKIVNFVTQEKNT